MLVEGEYFNKEIRSLKGFSDAKKIVFNNKIPNDIDKIEHLKLDKERSGNIVAYIKDNTIYISSNEKIYANEYSYALMKDLKNIEEVDLSNLDTSKVVDISSLFNGCSNLKTINVDNLNTSKVKNMSEMFTNCNNLKEIDLEDIDTENVENMSNMFFGCFNLEKLDLSNFKTSKVEDMSRMFAGCSNLKSVDLEYLNTSNVTNMDYMLYGCYNLNANINIENVVSDYNKVFEHCSEEEGSKLTVNYTNDKTKMIAENMIKTKSDLSNIVLGNILKSKIDNNKNND